MVLSRGVGEGQHCDKRRSPNSSSLARRAYRRVCNRARVPRQPPLAHRADSRPCAAGPRERIARRLVLVLSGILGDARHGDSRGMSADLLPEPRTAAQLHALQQGYEADLHSPKRLRLGGFYAVFVGLRRHLVCGVGYSRRCWMPEPKLASVHQCLGQLPRRQRCLGLGLNSSSLSRLPGCFPLERADLAARRTARPARGRGELSFRASPRCQAT